jgi:drug/metabolite transporter (DMT)-like permease
MTNTCRMPLNRLALTNVPLWVLETLMVVAWSSGFVGMRFSINHAPVFLVMFWRCVVLGTLLLPLVLGELRRTPVRISLQQGGIGLLAIAAYLAGVSRGIELGVPAGVAALIADLLPMGTALVAAVALRERLSLQVWLGLAIGLAGVLLVTHNALAIGRAPVRAYLMPLLGMLALAVATLWQQRSAALRSLSPLTSLWLQCVASGPVFAVLQGGRGDLLPIASTGFAASVAWSAGLSTLGGYGLYWVCLRRATPTHVASVLYLSPAVTMLWAWAMFAEPLSWVMFAGTAVSGVGILFVIKNEAAGSGKKSSVLHN